MEVDDKVEIIRSNKGGLKLIHRGYMYTVHKKRQGGGIRWRCTQRGLHCKGSISTGNGAPKVNMPHNHVPDPHSVALARCRQIEDCSENPNLHEEESFMEKVLFKMAAEKRIRKLNFSTEEVNILIDGVKYYKDVLFGRLSPHVPATQRENAWAVIQKNVNSASATCRSIEELKTKWKHLKQDAKSRIPNSFPVHERLNQSAPAAVQSLKSSPPPLKSLSLPATQTNQQNNRSANSQSVNNTNTEEKDPDEVCLRWNSHHTNMKTTFPSLLEKEQYVDVTLCSEGKTIKCHRMILSSCSSYFEEVLAGITPLQHPVIFLKGIPFWILKALIDFMYVGEVHIEQTKLQEILEVAETLKVKGLTGKTPQPPTKEVKAEPKPSPNNDTGTSAKTQKFMPPLRLSVSKDQAVTLQTIDPLSLLKPTFYEENSVKKNPIQIKPKMSELTPKQKEWLSKKIAPRKKLKRKSSEHEPSPPPVILRKGTKSRPIVKAPKYYHMEYEENEGKTGVKIEDEEVPETTEEPEQAESAPPALEVTPLHTFDISNVKSEPIDVDIEENMVDYRNFEENQKTCNEEAPPSLSEEPSPPDGEGDPDENPPEFIPQIQIQVVDTKSLKDKPGGTKDPE